MDALILIPYPMRARHVLLSAALLVAAAALSPEYECIGCTIVLALAEEGALADLEKAALKLCKGKLACEALVYALVDLASRGVSPDVACEQVKLCNVTDPTTGATCKLFPTQWPVVEPPAPPVWPPAASAAQYLSAAAPSAEGGGAALADATPEEALAPLRQLFSSVGSGIGGDGGGFHSAMLRAAGLLQCLKSAADGLVCAAAIEDVAARRFRRSDEVNSREAQQLAAYPSSSSSSSSSLAVGDGPQPNPCGLNVSCNVNRFANSHYPLTDVDGDGFSADANGTLRGWHWRGRDCAHADNTVYPGRKINTLGQDVDHNCNGIVGGNSSGSYEDLLCAGTEQRGLIVLGDSASAHFHVPPRWLTARGWQAGDLLNWETTLEAEDELDRPDCSWGTGFKTAEECPYNFGFPVASLYQRVRARNQCNHRDYQNMGVNGMRMTAIMNVVNSTSRFTALDHPALVMLAVIGNDVCSGHPGDDHFTPVDEFEAHARQALAVLDTKLAPGSFVAALGLVDGRILWDSMHAQQHPMGSTYEELYAFLSCLGLNPCWGWLNSNSTWRDATTAHAQLLSAVYEKLEGEQNYTNFKLVYETPDWPKYIADYVATGGKATDLIEPVDGFHPSQAGNMYLASSLWSWFEKEHPEALGAVNPHNAEITSIFGDQGGH